MPDFSMWGPAESGTRLAQMDAMKMAQTGMEMRQEAAHTDYLRMEAEKARYGLENEKLQQNLLRQQAQMAQAAQQPSPEQQISQSDQMANLLDRQAQMLAGAGFGDKAMKYAEGAQQIRTRAANADHQRATTQHLTNESRQMYNAAVEQYLGNAKNDQDWQIGLLNLQRDYPSMEMPADLKNSHYDPKVAEAVRSRALSLKDASMIQMRVEDLQFKARSAVRQESHDAAMEAHWDRQDAATAAREARIAKGGGTKAMPAVPKDDIKFAFNLIRQEFPAVKEKNPGAIAMSEKIAGDAQAMMRANPNISHSQAVTRAYAAAKANGEIKPGQDNRWDLPIVGKVGKPPSPSLNPIKQISPVQAAVEALGQSYEPETYDYRLGPNGEVQRKKK